MPRSSGAGPVTPPPPNVVLLGGPGSGKGTQAARLAAALRIPHISTGDLFRDHVERATRLGQRARRFMDAGELVPDDITRGMVRDRLREPDTEAGFILDGYPRTQLQAAALDVMLDQLSRRLSQAIYLRVSDAELVARMGGRGREDDNAKAIRNRLRVFHRYNAPLVTYYAVQGLLAEVDGEGEPEDVFARLIGIFQDAPGFTTI